MNAFLRRMMALFPLLTLGVPALGEAQRAPQEEITLTVLFDNLSADDRLRTAWGFAALIETPGHTVLFDTGADGGMLLENLRLLGKDPSTIEAVVLSHAHGDHTGGLDSLLALGIRPRLFLLAPFPEPLKRSAATRLQVVEAAPGQEIAPGIRTTGQVGEAIAEQALMLETAEGVVVLTGCAHPGALEMTRRARQLADRPIHAVLGGFHLGEATDAQLRLVVDGLRGLGVARAGPTHCSGLPAMTAFQAAYGSGFVPMGAGRVLRFPVAVRN